MSTKKLRGLITTIYENRNCGENGQNGLMSAICVRCFSAHFYLNNPTAKYYTTIMLVICVSSKRYKISTQCQVVPSYWDNVRECPLISINEEMNEHNQRVYENLTLIKKEVNELFSTLQKGDETINVQREIEKIMAKRKAKESTKEEINIEVILREGFRKMYEEKQANRKVKASTLNQQRTTLNKLIKNIKNIEDYNTIEFLSENGYEDLKDYLCETYGITKYQSEQCRMFAEIINYIRTNNSSLNFPGPKRPWQ